MEEQMKSMIFGLVLILFGVSLIPVIFTALSSANWSLVVASTTYNLSWVGYIVGLCFTLALVGVGVSILVKSFK